ncbi:Muskelin 1, intracellular mediator containing kelch motif [Tulasnella sp. 419]|nr:Muskelin 1, intracellular mediator containing kelch motif [Tulasnella sp. 419]
MSATSDQISTVRDTSSLAGLQQIGYTIEACSSHTNQHCPENILVNKPNDLSSRWSGIHHAASEGFQRSQWILLKLDTLAIVRAMVFGKASICISIITYKT